MPTERWIPKWSSDKTKPRTGRLWVLGQLVIAFLTFSFQIVYNGMYCSFNTKKTPTNQKSRISYLAVLFLMPD